MEKVLKRERLSIDVSPKEHKLIKMMAALEGKTIKDYVIECIKAYIEQNEEDKILESMTRTPSIVLEKLWDNDEDSIYDKL